MNHAVNDNLVNFNNLAVSDYDDSAPELLYQVPLQGGSQPYVRPVRNSGYANHSGRPERADVDPNTDAFEDN